MYCIVSEFYKLVARIHRSDVHRRSQGVHRMYVHPSPPGQREFLGLIYRESCKCTPKAERVQFLWKFLLGGRDLERESG